MEAGDWGGILSTCILASLVLGAWLGWLVGRHGLRPVRDCRVSPQPMQLQVLVERPNGERVWADVAGEAGKQWDGQTWLRRAGVE